MKNTFLWCVVGMIVISLCAVVLAVFSGAGRQAPEELSVQEGVASESVAPQRAVKYILGEYKGRLAVYSGGKSEPDLVFDVYIHYLPELDREQLQKGIPVTDYEELVRLIEDYSS